MKKVSLCRWGLLGALVLLGVLPVRAQTALSLQEAVSYALTKNINIKNSQLDATSAEARIGEIRAAGLPQINGQFGITDNLIIQRVFLPANAFGGDPSVPANAPPIAVQFGVKYSGNIGATLNQLIFNGSYFVGLKAAATYRELAKKNVTQSKVNVVEAVTKAYYSAQVAEERAKVLDLNIQRLDTLMRDTRATFQSGFVEKIDVDRLEVQLNNLKTERQKVTNLIELSYTLLKFQMGMPLTEQISLTDQVREIDITENSISGSVEYDNRIEYSILNTQGKLAGLDIRNIKSGYLPSVAGVLSYGHNNGRNDFGDLFTSRWFNNSVLGLNVQIPIFDGLTKHYKLQQAQITLDKLNLSRDLLAQSIDLQVQQAGITLKNSLETLETQRRNVDLAQEVVRVSKIKYQEGVGSNIEVINAESSLKEAQTNYFAALYDVLIAKVDLTKARGELYTGE